MPIDQTGACEHHSDVQEHPEKKGVVQHPCRRKHTLCTGVLITPSKQGACLHPRVCNVIHPYRCTYTPFWISVYTPPARLFSISIRVVIGRLSSALFRRCSPHPRLENISAPRLPPPESLMIVTHLFNVAFNVH